MPGLGPRTAAAVQRYLHTAGLHTVVLPREKKKKKGPALEPRGGHAWELGSWSASDTPHALNDVGSGFPDVMDLDLGRAVVFVTAIPPMATAHPGTFLTMI